MVHSRTSGDRVREGARKGEERSPRRGSAVAGADRGLVEVLRTGTVVGPSTRDVGRTKQQEHLHIQPTPTSPFQNQPLRPFKSTTTFLRSHSKTPRIQLNSEDCPVLYRSRSSGWSHGKADVIIRPDWTGPSCGAPFWAGVSARHW